MLFHPYLVPICFIIMETHAEYRPATVAEHRLTGRTKVYIGQYDVHGRPVGPQEEEIVSPIASTSRREQNTDAVMSPTKPSSSGYGEHSPPDLIKRLSQDEREALEKRLRRKLDIRILPAVITMFILNHIDR